MSKRNNVNYIKPADPKFLQQLKAQIGYNSGPTIDSKRQKLDIDSDSDRSDCDEESPQIVVLKKGDLTAEEAEREQKRIEKEETEKPADLSQRIVFKSKSSEKSTAVTAASSSSSNEIKSKKKDKKRPSHPEVSKSKLSFQIEDEEDEDNE